MNNEDPNITTPEITCPIKEQSQERESSKEIEGTPAVITIEKDQSSNQELTTIPRKRKKFIRSGQIDYLGTQAAGLEKRVSSFKMPIEPDKEIEKQIKTEVDIVAIKRSQVQLGISNVEVQKFLYPRYLRPKQTQVEETIQVDEQQFLMRNGPLLPQIQQSKVIEIKQYCQLGVGTYSQLDTLNLTRESKQSNQLQSKQFKRSIQRLDSSRQEIIRSKKSTARRTKTQFQKEEMSRQQMVYLPVLKRSHVRKRLSLDNRVMNVRIQKQEKQSHMPVCVPVTHHKVKKRHESCKDSPIHNNSTDMHSFSDSDIDPYYNITITNISLNFQKNTFGNKYIELTSQQAIYSTEQLKGNNLVWIGKNFSFSHVGSSNQLVLLVKSEQKILGRLKITLGQLLLNKKQNYYQSLVLSEKEVIGNMIIGYQISKDRKTLVLQQFKQQISSATQVKKKVSRGRRSTQHHQYDTTPHKLPEPKMNPIKARKYQGGNNIKIGRASRFENGQKGLPGPGKYQIQSTFSRHAIKQY